MATPETAAPDSDAAVDFDASAAAAPVEVGAVTAAPADGAVSSSTLPAATIDGKDSTLVQSMFDRVAPRYDLANAVLSMGQDAHWRRVTARAARPPGRVIADVAAGPGNVAGELLKEGAAHVLAIDLSYNMLAEGQKSGLPDVTWINGDALALPLADDSVDAVTISFGLRNLPDPQAGIAEFARVVKPGGDLVIAEFAAPTNPTFARIYNDYLVAALPRVAQVVSSDAPAYTYLAESIMAWPDRATLAGWMEAEGFTNVEVKNLAGGIVAVHRGRRAA